MRNTCLAPPRRMVMLVNSVLRDEFLMRATLLLRAGSPVSCVTLEMLVVDDACVETVAAPVNVVVPMVVACAVATLSYCSGTATQLVERWNVPRFRSCIRAEKLGISTPSTTLLATCCMQS